MNERLDKFFALHRVLSLYKPGGYATMVQCELTIEELHQLHPNCFDLNDLGKMGPLFTVFLSLYCSHYFFKALVGHSLTHSLSLSHFSFFFQENPTSPTFFWTILADR